MNREITFFMILVIVPATVGLSQTDINQKLDQLDLKTAGLDEIIVLFGEPEKYVWGKETFPKENLPDTYVAVYPNGLSFYLSQSKVKEIRHEGPTGYRYKDKLEVGSSLETALEVLGPPTQTVSGEANGWVDGVLYKDIDGRKGYCYYQRSDQNVRLFFGNYKVAALYITNPYFNKNESGGSGGITPVKAVDSVDFYDDVRNKDLSKVTALKNDLIRSLRFNQDTAWPSQAVGSKTIEWFADKILQSAMNPGLGVRQLHKMGITGKGVNVAIIDQPTYQKHPEFAGKITAYYDTGCETDESSMHGPAVTSLLVGENCGTAPGARVFYAAAPSWKKDTAYEAKALDWIVEQNKKLTASEKIRVVSVSAAPSSPNVRDKNLNMWEIACARAEADGIMVLDCTDSRRGFIGKCWYNASSPENVAQCNPWDPPNTEFKLNPNEIGILVPASPRTVAEEKDDGSFGYQYCGRGGLSWAIPYAAGVLAMGWQVWPEATQEQMKELLFQSAYTNKDGAKIINPPQFINAVKKAQKARTP